MYYHERALLCCESRDQACSSIDIIERSSIDPQHKSSHIRYWDQAFKINKKVPSSIRIDCLGVVKLYSA